MKNIFIRPLIVISLTLFCNDIFAQQQTSDLVDVFALGSEKAQVEHLLKLSNAEIFTGALQEKALRLQPLATSSWYGGKVSFKLKVNATEQNYITVKLWGSDISTNRLYLVCEGKQIGYRHLGDIDILDGGSESPFYNDRFFYNTSPLPLSFTKGKTEIQIEIRSQGAIWGYGQTWEKYQKDMILPTRGLYTIYTHTSTQLPIPKNEKQGEYSAGTLRKNPGEEILELLKNRVNKEIDNLISNAKPLNQMQMQFLAKAYHEQWSAGYQRRDLVEKVLVGLDHLYLSFLKNPILAQQEPSTWNPEWFGVGPSGQVLDLLKDAFGKKLDEQIVPDKPRRTAFAEMLVVCRDWHQQHRRLYTNQSMINDLYGIYYSNKGLRAISPDRARPEKEVLRYLRESLGIEPWLGSDLATGLPTMSAGADYLQLTTKGLTKELGFVGNYGEVLDWATEIYEATKSNANKDGDLIIKAQLIKIAQARAAFRYPMLDDEGYKAMRAETYVGWRDTHYPGDITYAQRPSWDGGPLQAALSSNDPKLLGYAQQMLADQQYFNVLEQQMKDKGFRSTSGFLMIPSQYEELKKKSKSGTQLPMTWEEPNFVFSDEEDGVVAIKNGKEILYTSLYWRARFGINYLARVHLISPIYNRIATVAIKEEFTPSGMFYDRPDWTNLGFGNGGIKYPDGLHSAHAGEKLPIAAIPDGTKFKPGNESPYAGRADYYELNFGDYLIAMNSSKSKTFTLSVPRAFVNGKNLVNNISLKGNKTVLIEPSTTVVIYKGVNY